MQGQLAKGMGHGLMSGREVELASMLSERFASMEQVRFTASGTEATMFAVRLARAFTGKTTFARMEGSYHGLHDMMSSGMGANIGQPWPGMEDDPVGNGVPPRVREEVAFLPFNDLEGCADVMAEHADDLAAVIVEPFMGRAAAFPRSPASLPVCANSATGTAPVLIFDEMISIGMSAGGAQGYYGVTPDLTACGKPSWAAGCRWACSAAGRHHGALRRGGRRSAGAPHRHVERTPPGDGGGRRSTPAAYP